MNELFKNGDYVLLEDCKAFDEKFGLEEGATMWAVARKMEGGEPRNVYMALHPCAMCVGISLLGPVGTRETLDEKDGATKLSVEDVLYRSKDGLTLDELSKIHGAFEEGKQYECVYSPYDYVFNVGEIYKANGDGIVEVSNYSCKNGFTVRFKPVTTKTEWVPKVGDEVIVHNDNDFELSYGKECINQKVTVMSIFKDGEVTVAAVSYNDINYCFVLSMLKPIDQERERIINSKLIHDVYLYAINKNEEISMKQSTGESLAKSVLGYLYNAGMLKEGDK